MANSDSKSMTAAEVVLATMPPGKWIEVRERQNGSFTVHYPDPGFIPCAPVCTLKQNVRGHKCDFEQKWIESTYKPTSYDDAMDWATYLAEGREVKLVKFVQLKDRRKKAQEIEEDEGEGLDQPVDDD